MVIGAVIQQLRAEGVMINHKRVARIMRENSYRCGLCAASCGLPIAITIIRYFPSLAARPSAPQDLNELWVADLTWLSRYASS
jgi:hypothetical protein